MRQKTLAFSCMLLLWFTGSQAQYLEASFAKHLSDTRNYQEVIDLTNSVPLGMSTLTADSLHFYRAWAYFNLKKVPEGMKNFRSISNKSVFFNRSKFYSSWSSIYLNEYDQAKKDLAMVKSPNLIEQELLHIQHTGIHLLNLRSDSALLSLDKLKATNRIYSDQIDLLKDYSLEIQNFKPKSMVLSGFLSAVVPGAGKIYAGEKGAGIGSFLLLAGMGGMAAENIIKSGFTSWNSLLFTGLFGVFYLGNIYGSLISIKTYRERFYESNEQAIVATILIPLRDYYR